MRLCTCELPQTRDANKSLMPPRITGTKTYSPAFPVHSAPGHRRVHGYGSASMLIGRRDPAVSSALSGQGILAYESCYLYPSHAPPPETKKSKVFN